MPSRRATLLEQFAAYDAAPSAPGRGGRTGVPRASTLTPEEQNVLAYSRSKMADGSYMTNEDGTVTTFRGAVDEIPGTNKTMYYPTFWDGKVLEPHQAMARALASGIKFPTYDTVDDALKAEARIHHIMESDSAALKAR